MNDPSKPTNIINLDNHRPKTVININFTNEEIQALHDEVLDVTADTFVGFCGIGILPTGEVTLASNIEDTDTLLGLLGVAIDTVHKDDNRI